MTEPSVAICGVGLVTPVGDNTAQVATSVEAGISRYAESSVYNSRARPMTMALLPEACLPELASSEQDWQHWTTRQVRMLRLAHLALDQLASGTELPGPIPLMLATPESLPGIPAMLPERFVTLLSDHTGFAIDESSSRAFESGRAAGVEAVVAAFEVLEQARAEYCLVGAVDSHLDLRLLTSLDAEGRVLADGVTDGFAPGEGAGFLLLARAGETGPGDCMGLLETPGLARENGHRYSDEPYLGDALADAIRNAVGDDHDRPIQTVLSSLNGESFGAREWGVAYLRNRDAFGEEHRFEHPADCYGDLGAASAPVLMGLAVVGMNQGFYAPPALVWCSSDMGLRGAVRIQPVIPEG